MAGLQNESWSTLLTETKPVLGQNSDQETSMNDYTMEDLSGKLFLCVFWVSFSKDMGVYS